jgi:hypothetical protein
LFHSSRFIDTSFAPQAHFFSPTPGAITGQARFATKKHLHGITNQAQQHKKDTHNALDVIFTDTQCFDDGKMSELLTFWSRSAKISIYNGEIKSD